MAHTCRGTISLHGAHIHTEDSCNFIVSNGGGTQTFHLRASSEVERQRWVTALELAKAKAIQRMESEDDESFTNDADDVDITAEIDKNELTNVVKMLGSKLEDLQTCHDLIVKHGLALQRSLGEIENSHNNPDNRTSEHGALVKAVNERATLFKITSNAMLNASAEFIELCQVSSFFPHFRNRLTTLNYLLYRGTGVNGKSYCQTSARSARDWKTWWNNLPNNIPILKTGCAKKFTKEDRSIKLKAYRQLSVRPISIATRPTT